MKKLRISSAVIVVIMMAMLPLSACADREAEQPEELIDYEIALITDNSLINDGGSSEVAWNAITEFGAASGISHKYYKAAEARANAFNEAIDAAVRKGAKVIIADDSTISDVIYEAQERYKGVDFILLNFDPYDDENGDILISDNTAAIVFATEEAGYLAGYAAVSEGYSNLGFIGGSGEKSMKNYACGFIKGANRAAGEAGREVSISYDFCSEDDPAAEAESKARRWYDEGVSVIFVCGSDIEDTVIGTAENCGGKVISGITDKCGLSDAVLTSAVEDIGQALTESLQRYSDGKFPGGEVIEYNAANGGISLILKGSRLKNADSGGYESIREMLAEGDISINAERTEDIEDIKDIKANRVTLKQ